MSLQFCYEIKKEVEGEEEESVIQWIQPPSLEQDPLALSESVEGLLGNGLGLKRKHSVDEQYEANITRPRMNNIDDIKIETEMPWENITANYQPMADKGIVQNLVANLKIEPNIQLCNMSNLQDSSSYSGVIQSNNNHNFVKDLVQTIKPESFQVKQEVQGNNELTEQPINRCDVVNNLVTNVKSEPTYSFPETPLENNTPEENQISNRHIIQNLVRSVKSEYSSSISKELQGNNEIAEQSNTCVIENLVSNIKSEPTHFPQETPLLNVKGTTQPARESSVIHKLVRNIKTESPNVSVTEETINRNELIPQELPRPLSISSDSNSETEDENIPETHYQENTSSINEIKEKEKIGNSELIQETPSSIAISISSYSNFSSENANSPEMCYKENKTSLNKISTEETTNKNEFIQQSLNRAISISSNSNCSTESAKSPEMHYEDEENTTSTNTVTTSVKCKSLESMTSVASQNIHSEAVEQEHTKLEGKTTAPSIKCKPFSFLRNNVTPTSPQNIEVLPQAAVCNIEVYVTAPKQRTRPSQVTNQPLQTFPQNIDVLPETLVNIVNITAAKQRIRPSQVTNQPLQASPQNIEVLPQTSVNVTAAKQRIRPSQVTNQPLQASPQNIEVLPQTSVNVTAAKQRIRPSQVTNQPLQASPQNIEVLPQTSVNVTAPKQRIRPTQVTNQPLQTTLQNIEVLPQTSVNVTAPIQRIRPSQVTNQPLQTTLDSFGFIPPQLYSSQNEQPRCEPSLLQPNRSTVQYAMDTRFKPPVLIGGSMQPTHQNNYHVQQLLLHLNERYILNAQSNNFGQVPAANNLVFVDQQASQLLTLIAEKHKPKENNGHKAKTVEPLRKSERLNIKEQQCQKDKQKSTPPSTSEIVDLTQTISNPKVIGVQKDPIHEQRIRNVLAAPLAQSVTLRPDHSHEHGLKRKRKLPKEPKVIVDFTDPMSPKAIVDLTEPTQYKTVEMPFQPVAPLTHSRSSQSITEIVDLTEDTPLSKLRRILPKPNTSANLLENLITLQLTGSQHHQGINQTAEHPVKTLPPSTKKNELSLYQLLKAKRLEDAKNSEKVQKDVEQIKENSLAQQKEQVNTRSLEMPSEDVLDRFNLVIEQQLDEENAQKELPHEQQENTNTSLCESVTKTNELTQNSEKVQKDVEQIKEKPLAQQNEHVNTRSLEVPSEDVLDRFNLVIEKQFISLDEENAQKELPHKQQGNTNTSLCESVTKTNELTQTSKPEEKKDLLPHEIETIKQKLSENVISKNVTEVAGDLELILPEIDIPIPQFLELDEENHQNKLPSEQQETTNTSLCQSVTKANELTQKSSEPESTKDLLPLEIETVKQSSLQNISSNATEGTGESILTEIVESVKTFKPGETKDLLPHEIESIKQRLSQNVVTKNVTEGVGDMELILPEIVGPISASPEANKTANTSTQHQLVQNKKSADLVQGTVQATPKPNSSSVPNKTTDTPALPTNKASVSARPKTKHKPEKSSKHMETPKTIGEKLKELLKRNTTLPHKNVQKSKHLETKKTLTEPGQQHQPLQTNASLLQATTQSPNPQISNLDALEFDPLKSSYFKIPKSIRKVKGVINIQNFSDHKCFMWSILASFHRDFCEHSQRISLLELDKHREELNMTGIEFPVPIEQIDLFERQNPNISVNVFGFNDQLIPLRITKFKRKQHVNLLHLCRGSMKRYCLIGDIKKFFMQRHPELYCQFCLKRFVGKRTAKNLKAHSEICFPHLVANTKFSIEN